MYQSLLVCFTLLLLTSSLTEVNSSEDVEFRLYSINNIDEDYLNITPESLGNFNYNKEYNYIFLLHGFGENSFNNDWYPRTIKKFLMKKDFVVVAAGYQNILKDNYNKSIDMIPEIGQRVAEIMIAMSKTKQISSEKFELIGYALGSHIAGSSGRYFTKNTNQKIKRIYAMDPDVIGEDNKNNLQESDATQVVVMHTSKQGIQKPIGHVDFYPNGGLSHQQCQQHLPLDDRKMGLYYFICSIIKDCRMYGTKCDNIDLYKTYKCAGHPQAKMGYGIDDDVEPGKYYLFTFCREMQGKIYI